MAISILTSLVVVLGCACAAPANDGDAVKAVAPQENIQDNSDLKADASTTYGRRYSDWGGYPGNSYITGYGILDDKYSGYNGGYDSQYGVRGYNRGYGYNGYAGNAGYAGYKGYSGYDGSGSGLGGGYGPNAFGTNGYGNSGGYGGSGAYGGYGGYGGNGGLNSYYGYNNPSYQGAGHLGYGYTKPGYGNIYSSAITPSLVTGYRGYSRR